MPIYEYICEDCGNKFEKLVRSTESKAVQCSKCESKNVKKVFSTFASSGTPKGAALGGNTCGCGG